MFGFLLIYRFCDKTRCLKILQERRNMFSPPRWRLFIVHKATLCTWIFGLRPQCTWSHPVVRFVQNFRRPSVHTFTQTREPQDPFDFISQRWKWRENVKYPTHTVAAVSVFSAMINILNNWSELYLKCTCRKTTNHFALWLHSRHTKASKADIKDGTTVTLHCLRLSDCSPKLTLLLLWCFQCCMSFCFIPFCLCAVCGIA